jgi:hypothetical protein
MRFLAVFAFYLENGYMKIARTILYQIIALDPEALLRYKATMFQAIPKCDEFEGGLKFTAKGKFIQGNVLIYLTWRDDYTIVFFTSDGVPQQTYIGVYFDMLITMLDFINSGDYER